MRSIYLFIGLLLLNLFFFAGGKQARLKKADMLSKTLFYPFLSSVSNFKNKKKLEKENGLIIKKLTQTTIQLQLLQNQLKELQNVQNFDFDKNYDYQIARVVGKGSSFLEKTLIIDKGCNYGIKKNYPVIDFEGIIGKIIAVANGYSIVLPYTNSNFHLSVMLKKNSEQGILKSNSSGTVFVDYLSLGSEIALGDTIVTSNLSTVFPEGFPVGTIKKIMISKDRMHKIAELKMFNNPAAIRTVIVIKYEKGKNYEQELQKLNS